MSFQEHSRIDRMGIVQMDDSVQIDLVEMKDHTKYRDQESDKLEDMLVKDSRFERYIVRRIKFENEALGLENPFSIQTKDGIHRIWLYKWEFDILSESEIIPYLDVKRKREEKSDTYICREVLGFVASMTGACMIVGLLFFLLIGQQQFVFEQLPTAVIGLAIGLLITYITYRRKRIGLTQLDIESAKENPLFISALRKLATLSGRGNKDMDLYAKRLQEIEGSHSDSG